MYTRPNNAAYDSLADHMFYGLMHLNRRNEIQRRCLQQTGQTSGVTVMSVCVRASVYTPDRVPTPAGYARCGQIVL